MSKKQPAKPVVPKRVTTVATVAHVAVSKGWGGKKTYIRYDLTNDVHIYVPYDKDPINVLEGDTLTFAKD